MSRSVAREVAQALRQDGEPVTLEDEPQPPAEPDSLAWSATPPPAAALASADTSGALLGWRSDHIVADAYQGDIEVRLSPVLLAEQGWQAPPRRGMTILARGHRFAVQACDTRSLGGVPVMHIVQARGGR